MALPPVNHNHNYIFLNIFVLAVDCECQQYRGKLWLNKKKYKTYDFSSQ